MWHFGYLLALAVAIGGTLWLDRHWRLVLWRDRRRASLAIGLGWAVFGLWDTALERFAIIVPGSSPFTTGWLIWPGLPVEELIFLWFLAYQPLIIWEGYKRWKA